MERLSPKTTAILVIDVQEKLAAAMPNDALAALERNVRILLEVAKDLGVAVIASEQYPKGLGPTIGSLANALGAIGVKPFPKLTFDACADLAIARALSNVAPRSVVVVGIEAHICVFQTVRELTKRGYATYVVADAVASRLENNRQIGLSLCERAGAVVTSTEAVAFDMLERAGTDAFKSISKLLR